MTRIPFVISSDTKDSIPNEVTVYSSLVYSLTPVEMVANAVYPILDDEPFIMTVKLHSSE
jgi:hypothetical protein